MRSELGWAGLVVVLALAGTAPAQDKNKGADKATQADYAALAQAGEVTGKLVHLDPGGKSLTVQLDVVGQPQVAKAAAQLQQQQHILHEQEKALRITNPVRRQQRLQQLAAEAEQLQLQEAQGQVHHKDFDLESTDDAQVRSKDPPVQYDDKGNVKKYTPEELKELRGDGKVPGYAADWTDLKVGQTVKLTLKPHDKTRDGGTDNDKKDDSRPRVAQVLIVKEAADGSAQDGKTK